MFISKKRLKKIIECENTAFNTLNDMIPRICQIDSLNELDKKSIINRLLVVEYQLNKLLKYLNKTNLI